MCVCVGGGAVEDKVCTVRPEEAKPQFLQRTHGCRGRELQS